MEKISKKEAKEKGLKWYFTGKPCKKGHVCERQTVSGHCKICKENQYIKHREKINKNRRENYWPEHYKKTKDKRSEYQKARLNSDLRPVILKKKREYNKKYYKNFSSLCKYRSMKRYCLRLKATPEWANQEMIKQIYKDCPKGYEVDHIIPLQGKNVCGLHVENNLQYLTKEQNRAKSNKVF